MKEIIRQELINIQPVLAAFHAELNTDPNPGPRSEGLWTDVFANQICIWKPQLEVELAMFEERLGSTSTAREQTRQYFGMALAEEIIHLAYRQVFYDMWCREKPKMAFEFFWHDRNARFWDGLPSVLQNITLLGCVKNRLTPGANWKRPMTLTRLIVQKAVFWQTTEEFFLRHTQSARFRVHQWVPSAYRILPDPQRAIIRDTFFRSLPHLSPQGTPLTDRPCAGEPGWRLREEERAGA